jgi:hypothetical protein
VFLAYECPVSFHWPPALPPFLLIAYGQAPILPVPLLPYLAIPESTQFTHPHTSHCYVLQELINTSLKASTSPEQKHKKDFSHPAIFKISAIFLSKLSITLA